MKASALTVIALTVQLTACATAAQREALNMRAGSQSAAAGFKTCVSLVLHRPEFAGIYPKLPTIDEPQATMSQLTNETIPTTRESTLLANRHDATLSCRQEAFNQMMMVEPRVAGALLSSWQRTDAIIVDLVKRRITWAEAARRAQQVGAENRADIQAAHEQVMNRLEEEHAAELARRQAAFQALSDYGMQMQMLNAATRPTITTCTPLGSFLNCVSH